MTDVQIKKSLPVRMRDGVTLATDVYLPFPLERGLPTLLARTPYDKNAVITGRERLDVIRAVEAGYAVVVQDVRGRHASDGHFDPHVQEPEDGADTIEWVAAQPWSNGLVGMFGGSYLGGTQLLAAREAPEALRVIAPAISFADTYEGMTHQGGAEILHPLVWAVSIAQAEAARQNARGASVVPGPGDTDTSATLARLPLDEHPFVSRFAPFYDAWLAHATPGPFWEKGSPSAGYDRMATPALHITGWYDIFLASTIENFQGLRSHAMTATARAEQRLVIGPWTHTDFSGSFPERDFGPEAAPDFSSLHLAWSAWRWRRCCCATTTSGAGCAPPRGWSGTCSPGCWARASTTSG